MGQAFRNLALDLLDDEDGVNQTAWNTLSDMLDDNGDNDITEAVRSVNGRYYLTTDAAALLRTVIKE